MLVDQQWTEVSSKCLSVIQSEMRTSLLYSIRSGSWSMCISNMQMQAFWSDSAIALEGARQTAHRQLSSVPCLLQLIDRSSFREKNICVVSLVSLHMILISIVSLYICVSLCLFTYDPDFHWQVFINSFVRCFMYVHAWICFLVPVGYSVHIDQTCHHRLHRLNIQSLCLSSIFAYGPDLHSKPANMCVHCCTYLCSSLQWLKTGDKPLKTEPSVSIAYGADSSCCIACGSI